MNHVSGLQLRWQGQWLKLLHAVIQTDILVPWPIPLQTIEEKRPMQANAHWYSTP